MGFCARLRTGAARDCGRIFQRRCTAIQLHELGGGVFLRWPLCDDCPWKVPKLGRVVSPAFRGGYYDVVVGSLDKLSGPSQSEFRRLSGNCADASDVGSTHGIGHITSSFCASSSARQLGP
jgi:hypothetical protein